MVTRAQLVIYCLIAVIALIGLVDASYLTVMHLTGEDVACGPSGGCSAVLSSAYASIGAIPTAAFGDLAYFAMFSFAVLAAFGYSRLRVPMMLLALVMLLASLMLLYLQAFVLHAFCPYCLLSAALTFFLTGLVLALPSSR